MSVRMFGAGHKGRTARLGWLVQRGDGLKGLRNAERGVNAKFGEAAKSVCVSVCVVVVSVCVVVVVVGGVGV